MSGFYRFPAMAKLGEWSDGQQVAKIIDEAKEASLELSLYDHELRCHGSNSLEADEYVERYGLELLDVIHACETALRMRFDETAVLSMQEYVIEKNRKRGYYGEES